MKLLHTTVRRFSPAFRVQVQKNNGNSHDTIANKAAHHRKQSKSTSNTIYNIPPSQLQKYDDPQQLSHSTINSNNNTAQQWTWRPAGHYSARGTASNRQFRSHFFQAMRSSNGLQHSIQWEMGRLSGMFWYPPGAVREWHTNYLDLKGSTTSNNNNKKKHNTKEEEIFSSQVWRMYYVRTVRDDDFDRQLQKLQNKLLLKRDKQNNQVLDTGMMIDTDWSMNDHSAMHIIPGQDEGITLEVLQNAGARLLNENEKQRRYRDIFAQEEEDSVQYSMGTNTDINATTTSSEESTSSTEFDRNAIWRIPDQDGYVTLFRLPSLWH
eukprot:scaffold113534_cov33-Cyclotella_meneghiniana.AAC.1